MTVAGLTPSRRTYAGLFLVTLATLTYEILLTRIFSVTMWYHFSFVAISVAMFGLSVGAILVYLHPAVFRDDRVAYCLSASALWFAVSALLSFLAHLCIHVPSSPQAGFMDLFSMVLFYSVISVPFIISGVCICLVLTRFTSQVGRLYAADLAGGAVGCVFLIYLLKLVDGPTAVIVVALLAACASVVFDAGPSTRRLRRVAVVCCVLLGLLAAANVLVVHNRQPLIRLLWVKDSPDPPARFRKWNSFSRITVVGDPAVPEFPFGWGLSAACPPDRRIAQMMLWIDSCAGTPLTRYDGDAKPLDFLKYDVTNVAYWIRPNPSVMAVGVGGGRDVLSALVFNARSVTGVEINEDILYAVNRKYGDFTGHLDRDPRVRFVNDEARSWTARQKDSFDIIQISLIDTWAATAAGAFVLAENSLYTVEAWNMFLQRLTPRGILTVSRWYYAGKPAEVYRLASLAIASLKSVGVADPARHIVIISNVRPVLQAGIDPSLVPTGVGTILLSREPFSSRDLDALEALCSRMGFETILSPRRSADPCFREIASGADLVALSDRLRLNVVAPTDDTPFFFNVLRLRDMFMPELWSRPTLPRSLNSNLRAVAVLGMLAITVVFLTLLCLIVPLVSRTRRGTLKGSLPLLLFFASIGVGFMLVEISQMQRLIVFLGHPAYGLSVVLFALPLSAGLGSYSTRRVVESRAGLPRLLALLVVLCVFGLLTPWVVQGLRGFVTPLRIAAAVVLLFPIGFFMGMAFPLGMRSAASRSAALTPWLWGINGATSVCASVFAVVIAMTFGISASFWTGFGCYVVAFLAFLWTSRRRESSPGAVAAAP